MGAAGQMPLPLLVAAAALLQSAAQSARPAALPEAASVARWLPADGSTTGPPALEPPRPARPAARRQRPSDTGLLLAGPLPHEVRGAGRPDLPGPVSVAARLER